MVNTQQLLHVISDLRTLALYVLGCDQRTYSPETAEVMDRMRPLLLDQDGKLRNDLDDNPFEETNL